MKYLLLILCLSFTIPILAQAEDEFELKPSQSMLMPGKGPGQDGASNPYAGQDCFAIVENMGKTEVSIRIQKKGKILQAISVPEGKTKKVKLLKDQELYLDASDGGMVKASLDFRPIEQK